MSTLTKEEIESGIKTVVAVGQAIRAAGEIPSGTVYAALMDRLNLQSYEKIIGILKNAKCIEESDSHILKWIGPK